MALKRARGIIERAMENFQSHKLLIAADALDLLQPFGEQLGLTGEEADLLMASLLARARPVPEWLIELSPSSSRLIIDASENADSEVRLRAVEATLLLRGDEMRVLLRQLALWDENLMVRKAASIALADWLGLKAEEILSSSAEDESAGIVRRAISLSMIRDYDKRMIDLSRLSIPVILLVIGGLDVGAPSQRRSRDSAAGNWRNAWRRGIWIRRRDDIEHGAFGCASGDGG